MSKKFIFLIIVAIIVILAAGYLIFFTDNALPNLVFWGDAIQKQTDRNTNVNSSAITNFDECVAAGNVILESYPGQCRTADGKTFIEDIGNEMQKIDMIKINSPRPNETITSPLNISGEAVGFWYFEATFPIRLEDADGDVVIESYATAQGEWMTENFVPFNAVLEFAQPQTKTGKLILQKSNPSDLPANDDSLIVPIKFE